MDHEEHGRPGRTRPGSPPARGGARQQPSRRSGGPRRLGPGRGAAARPARPPQRPPAAPYDDFAPYEDPPVTGRPSARGGPRPSAQRRPSKQQRRPAKPKRPATRRSPRAFFAAAGVLGVILVVAAVAVVLNGGRDEAPAREPAAAGLGPVAASGQAPSSYSSSPSSDAYAGIAERTADRAPLTEAESFPKSAAVITLPEAKAKLALKAKRLDGDCAAAIWGRGLADALGQGGCTQAGRALYADTRKGYALAVTVFNLAGAEHADRVVERLGEGRGGGFVRPLTASAPLDSFGQGFSAARGLAMGHYVVVAWAQRLDGRGDEQDEALLSLVIEGGKAPAVLGRAARAA
ncbi:hypothetical protein [Spirillospora sp. NPDC047279]|uniref:hypothetical protein n=1 Tax=Spirillospora sp. NPDC047279 TaxID=3155478 RepID=UPI0033EEBE46